MRFPAQGFGPLDCLQSGLQVRPAQQQVSRLTGGRHAGITERAVRGGQQVQQGLLPVARGGGGARCGGRHP